MPGPRRDDAKSRTAISIKKALRHEATHVAQACKKTETLGILKTKTKLHKWYKKNAVIKSTAIGNISKERELEAYYMEDRPRKVISALKKYCL